MKPQNAVRVTEQAATVVTIRGEDTVVDASTRMWEKSVGCLPVVDAVGKLVGIITERDIVTRVLANRANPAEMLVKDFMTRDVVSCAPGTAIHKVRETMTRYRVRHVPITEDGVPVGIVSSREVMAAVHDRDRSIHDLTIFAMARLAESRDPDTGGHLERVCDYARILAGALEDEKFSDQIDARFVALIAASSSLHDIGKVGIPDCVLLKPGRLDPLEYEIMKTHTVKGAETLESVLKLFPDAEFLRMGRDIARYHHERVDGTGYPDGLTHEDIPLCARLFAVGDVYDALVGKRVYKEAYSPKIASNTIIAGSGTQFDPDVVQVFLRCQQEFEEIKDRYEHAQAAA